MLKESQNSPEPHKHSYSTLLAGVIGLLEQARRYAVRSISVVMTEVYWKIGHRIVEHEQKGKRRAGYGEVLLENLAKDLTERFGRGFSRTNLQQMREFYLNWPIRQTPSGESTTRASQHTREFALPWSHYVRLLSVRNSAARTFYEGEALQGGWSVRQLDRQIASQFYERTVVSRDKAALLRQGQVALPEDLVEAQEEIRDSFVLEFLGLKDEYSESELEEGLIRHLEHFLLELGSDFAFMARQKRLRIGNEWYRIDLLFFHRRLQCLVVIDLKIGRFTHADAGQMNLYLNYAREQWAHKHENPPVGLILCSEKDDAVAHYALGNLRNKVLSSEYRLSLPDEERLAEEIARTRKALQFRVPRKPNPQKSVR